MVSNLYKAVASFGTETEERYWDCSLDHYYSCGKQAYIKFNHDATRRTF